MPPPGSDSVSDPSTEQNIPVQPGCGASVRLNCQKNSKFLTAILFLFNLGSLILITSITHAQQPDTSKIAQTSPTPVQSQTVSIHSQYSGSTIRGIQFSGIMVEQLAPLPQHLALQIGAPLKSDSLAQSIRQLFATGLYVDIEARVTPLNDGVLIDFHGQPRRFIGGVAVTGAKSSTLNAQLEQSAELTAGTRFTEVKLSRAIELMQETMARNGFHQAKISSQLTPRPTDQLVDLTFQIEPGPQARVGKVTLTGDVGMTVEDFRRAAHLRLGALIDHDTNTRALAGVLSQFRKQNRFEAEIKLLSNDYDPKANDENFQFSVNRGPVVRVLVNGAKPSESRIRHLIPVFEEGSVDEDLLMEGNRALRDYYQSKGYFNAKVEHSQPATDSDPVIIQYTVHLGQRSRVAEVKITGNHYFDTATLRERLSVHASDAFDRQGTYSQAMLNADVAALRALYVNNGFASVSISPLTTEAEIPAIGKQVPLKVVYEITEGPQQRIASVRIDGVQQLPIATLTPILNTRVGQPLSPQNLAGDRDALITYYLDKGFDQVNVDVVDTPVKPGLAVAASRIENQQPAEETKSNALSGKSTPHIPQINTHEITFRVQEGRQLFVRNILVTGLHFTRPGTIAKAITFKAGDPLSKTEIARTQRSLYDFALFSEVNMAVVNPVSSASQAVEPNANIATDSATLMPELPRTVLIQTTEANRWSFTYGLGFEASTGTCGIIASSGNSCPANGKTGVSPRVLLDITRSNLSGREQSLSLRGTYGLLEQKINLLYQTPRLFGSQDYGFNISGGYANTQDVTTYVSSSLDGGFKLTQRFLSPGDHLNRANTFVYDLAFRRVKVDSNSIQVEPSEIATLTAAVRVSGIGFTWIRDTRDSPLDAHSGTYTSAQNFFSHQYFGAQAEFDRLDLSHSSFHSFDNHRFVFARNTRYAQARSFGSPSEELIPLPERLYAGGANSHRGFGVNTAGPRDPFTGYPIGGAGAFVNTSELRLPPPTLPFVSNSLSFVLFHDMGNVFTNAGDIWPSFLRTVQPDRSTCRSGSANGTYTATGWQGTCSFNYFDHAAGIGLRYHTPVGPVRLDMSYNINPPIYPVSIVNGVTVPSYVGQGPHFNFFFSLGQSF
jgi:outer membrane protein insertion porin family